MSIGGSATSSSSAGLDSQVGSDMAAGKGGNFSDQRVYAPQDAALGAAYNNMSNVAPGVQQGVNNFLNNETYSGTINDATGNLMGMGDPQALIDAQSGSLKAGLNDLYGQGSSQIGSNAANAGAFGGARQGIQEAALGGEIADAYTKGYGDIVANARNQSMQANNSAIAGANTGFNQGLQGQLAQLAPAQAWLQSLGGPTVLGSSGGFTQDLGLSSSYGSGSNNSFSEGAKFGFGLK